MFTLFQVCVAGYGVAHLRYFCPTLYMQLNLLLLLPNHQYNIILSREQEILGQSSHNVHYNGHPALASRRDLFYDFKILKKFFLFNIGINMAVVIKTDNQCKI